MIDCQRPDSRIDDAGGEFRRMADIAEVTCSTVKAVDSRLYGARKELRAAPAPLLN